MKQIAELAAGVLATFALMLSPDAAFARVLQPATYTSPSGAFTLGIDPQDRSGDGSAIYTLRQSGTVVWSGNKAFALREAIVADDGSVGGYAYADAASGREHNFIVAVIDPTGVVRTEDRTLRESSHYLHTDADPKAAGVFLDPTGNRFIVRVTDRNSGPEAWWVYRLGDGRKELVFKPLDRMSDSKPLHDLIAARPVAQTPLTLVQWYRYDSDPDFRPGIVGTRFVLIDEMFREVWSLDLPDDFVVGSGQEAQQALLRDVTEGGTILATSRPGRFEVRKVGSGTRMVFSVEPASAAPHRWRVQETGTTSYVPDVAAAPSTHDERPLRKLGEIRLGNAGADESPIRDVGRFAIGEGSRFAFSDACGCGTHATPDALLIVDDKARLVRRVPLPAWPEEKSYADHVAWIAGNRWLVTSSPSDRDAKSVAVVVDGDTAAATPLVGFVAPEITSLAAASDGSFYALVETWSGNSPTEGLLAFNGAGQPRWHIGGNFSDESNVFSAQGVTVTTAGEVVVLENVTDKLKVYAADGAFRRSIDLEKAWGRKPNYPSEIVAGASGSIFVNDFHGSPSIVHMSTDGKVLGQFNPLHASGSVVDIRGGIANAPDGSIWSTDGQAFMRLDARGRVDRIVGGAPDADVLGDIDDLFVRSDGMLYAADVRTSAIHVFDASGKALHVCRPGMSDYADGHDLDSLTTTDGGDVYASRKASPEIGHPEFLHYDAKGRRLGVEALDIDHISQKWIAQPESARRWVLGYENVFLVDFDDKVVRRIERDGQRHWLLGPGPASVAADGSLALVSANAIVQDVENGHRDGYGSVTIYSASGEALSSWPGPAHRAATSPSTANGSRS
jgi:hypothetical protein